MFRYKFGSYPLDNVRFAEREALATRIYAADVRDLPDANQASGKELALCTRATDGADARDVAQLKATANDGRIDSMELFDAKRQLIKSISYEYASHGGKVYLRRQTVVLPERPMMVGFKGEGMKVTLDGKEYRYRDLEARHHAGGRRCTVEYELVTLGAQKIPLPVRVTVRDVKDDRVLRSVRMMNFKKLELDAAGVEQAARQFAVVTRDERQYEQLRLKYWKKAPDEIEDQDREAIEQLRSHFEKALAAANSSTEESLKHLNILMELNMMLGDKSELEGRYRTYLSTLTENKLLWITLVGGYGVIETAMFRGRRNEAGMLLDRWVDSVLPMNDAESVLLFARRQLAKNRLWTTIRLLESFSAKHHSRVNARFEAEVLRCAALHDLCKLLQSNNVAEKGLVAKVQADWVASIGKDSLDRKLADTMADAERSFTELSAPTESQQALKSQLDKIDQALEKEKNQESR